jgi:uncharacterized SAM-binding protein YcdF (DUF218 family)
MRITSWISCIHIIPFCGVYYHPFIRKRRFFHRFKDDFIAAGWERRYRLAKCIPLSRLVTNHCLRATSMNVDTLFFLLSKLFWLLCSPESLLVILALSCLFFIFRKAYKKATLLSIFLSVSIFGITVLPVGDWALYPLEKRFPPVARLSPPIDGIIVLGGSEKIYGSFVWQQVELNDHSERYFAFIKLARQFPHAVHVYTGGTGDPLLQEYKGADVAQKLFEEQGLDISTILFESQSRNTFENAVQTRNMVKPGPAQRWVLITSASHMPRALGIFYKTGWKVMPYPVNHDTNPETLFRITWNFSGNLSKLDSAAYEWAGLLAYYLTGKTSHLFPGPLDLN